MEHPNSGRSPLRILMAASVPKRREGGVAAIIYNLGRELQTLGHQVTYLFLEDLVPLGSAPSRFVDLIFSLRLARYISQNSVEFSVVNLHAPSGLAYGLLRRWRPSYPPYVMTLHGLEERRVHVMSREQKKGRAWNFRLENRLWHRFYIFPRFRWSIRTADAAHTYSRDVWTLLQLKYNLDSDRVAYIPNGVEQRFFSPRQYHSNGSLRLLYVGTWLDQRGIFYLREAFQRLSLRFPELTLTIAGPATPAGDIFEFFGRELTPRIEVRPVTPADSMHTLYLEHDIFVFPSLMEGLPSALLEAMASGMPVITAETCGMPDVVENNFNGLLVPPADSLALEEAIVRLTNSEELRCRLGSAARETMRRYTWTRSALQLERLFRSALEN